METRSPALKAKEGKRSLADQRGESLSEVCGGRLLRQLDSRGGAGSRQKRAETGGEPGKPGAWRRGSPAWGGALESFPLRGESRGELSRELLDSSGTSRAPAKHKARSGAPVLQTSTQHEARAAESGCLPMPKRRENDRSIDRGSFKLEGKF